MVTPIISQTDSVMHAHAHAFVIIWTNGEVVVAILLTCFELFSSVDEEERGTARAGTVPYFGACAVALHL